MACTLEIKDPNFTELIKEYNGDFEAALEHFLENYDKLKAPKSAALDKYAGKIVYMENPIKKDLPKGVINGDLYETPERLVEFSNRGYTIVGNSDLIKLSSSVTLTRMSQLFREPVNFRAQKTDVTLPEVKLNSIVSNSNRTAELRKVGKAKIEELIPEKEEQKTLSEVLQDLEDVSATGEVNAFLDLLQDVPVSVVFTENINNEGKYKDGVIYLNPNIIADNALQAIQREFGETNSLFFMNSESNPYQAYTKLVLGHELVHALTVSRIKDYLTTGGKNLSKKEKELIKELERFYKKHKSKFPKEVTDLYEFVSRALTSPSFARSLNKFRDEDLSLFERFVGYIKSLLGIESPLIGEIAKELVLTYYDVNRDTLRSIGEDFNFRGATPSMDLLQKEAEQAVGVIYKRITLVEHNIKAVASNKSLSTAEKAARTVELNAELRRLNVKLDTYREGLTLMSSIVDFLDYETRDSFDFYQRDVTEIFSEVFPFADRTLRNIQAQSPNTPIDLEKLLSILQDLNHVSRLVEKWKKYSSVKTEEEMKNHLFAPLGHLKGLSDADRQRYYMQYFSGEVVVHPSHPAIVIPATNSMVVAEKKYLELQEKIIKLIIDNDAFIKESGIFDTQPFLGGLTLDTLNKTPGKPDTVTEGNLKAPAEDLDILAKLVGVPSRGLSSIDHLISKLMKLKMDEIDALAIADFNVLVNDLNKLYEAAYKEAERVGKTLTKLFFQTISVNNGTSQETLMTGNLVARYSEEWKAAKSAEDTRYRGILQYLRYQLNTKAITSDQYAKALQAAVKDNMSWIHKNMEILDAAVLPEIRSHISLTNLQSSYGNQMAAKIRQTIEEELRQPENTAYRQELIDTYGQAHYDEIIEEQKRKLDEYVLDLIAVNNEIQNDFDLFREQKGFKKDAAGDFIVTDPDAAFFVYAHTTSPFVARIGMFSTRKRISVAGRLHDIADLKGYYNEGRHNISMFPRRYKATHAVSNVGGIIQHIVRNILDASGQKIQTDYYDKNFEEVEKYPAIKNYYDKYNSVLELANTILPRRLKRYLESNSLPLLELKLKEFLLDGESGERDLTYFLSSRKREAFRKLLHWLFYAPFTSIAKKEKTKQPEIKEKEKDVFLQIENKNRKFEVLYALLVEEEKAKRGGVALTKEIKKYLKYKALDTITKEHSKDLHGMALYYAKFMVLFSHKENSLPLLDTLFDMYKDIRQENGSIRPHGIERMRYAFDIWKFNPRHETEGQIGSPKVSPKDKEIAERLDAAIASAAAAGLKDVEKLLTEERESLNRKITGSKFADSLIKSLRYLRLAGAELVAIYNRFQGITGSNVDAAANEDNGLDIENLAKARNLMLQSTLKFFSFGAIKTPTARKIRNILRKLDALEDMTDEVQKAGNHHWWNKDVLDQIAWTFQKSTEYLNQGEVVLTTLLKEKIQDNNGKTFSVFDALNTDGEIKPEFSNSGFDWNTTKGKIVAVRAKARRNKTQGDYTNTGTQYLKRTALGRIVGLFHTWLGEFISNEYAKEQFAPGIGEIKGVSRSLTAGQLLARQLVNVSKVAINPVTTVLPILISAGGFSTLVPALGFVTALVTTGMVASEAVIIGLIVKYWGNQTNFNNSTTPLGDFAQMSKAILQRAMYRPFYRLPGVGGKFANKVNSQFETPELRSKFSNIDRQNMRKAAEQGGMALYFMSIQALMLFLLFNPDDKDPKDNPLLNFLMKSVDKITSDLLWATRGLSKQSNYDDTVFSIFEDPFGAALDFLSGPGNILRKAVTRDYATREEHAYEMAPNEDSMGNALIKSVTPSAYSQPYNAYQAYKYSWGFEYPYNRVAGSESEQKMQKQAIQEHGRKINKQVLKKKAKEKKDK